MVLFGCLLGCLMLASCGETEKKRRTVGYKGEARSNAFLGAQRLLEQRGIEVDSRQGMGGLDYNTSTIFLPPSSLNTVGRSKRVLEWVSNGGHLVVMLRGGEKRGNDFTMRRSIQTTFGSDERVPGLDYLMEQIGVEMVERKSEGGSVLDTMDRDDWEAMEERDRVLLDAEETEVFLGGHKMRIHHWPGNALSFDRGLMHERQDDGEYGAGKKDGVYRFLSLYWGGGRVSILSDASPFRNRYIGYGDHASFLIKLVEESRTGAVMFSSGDGDGFFSLVWRHFRMAVYGLLALVVFWLWRSLPRFGPIQDLPDGGSREFSTQVRGVGRFLWRHKRDDAMLASMRGAVTRRLSLYGDGSHEGIFEQLAAGTGLPVESVIEAMTRENVREPGVMVRVTRNLQKIDKSIN